MTGMTHGQEVAHAEIMRAYEPGVSHLLDGDAGTGKTWLMSRVVQSLLDRGLTVAVCAPTHKAAGVIARKLRESGLGDVPVGTVHQLLSLIPDKSLPGEGLTFHRRPGSKAPDVNVVIMDECSMISTDLMLHIRRQLRGAFILYVGDSAQLPPVNEGESESFSVKSRSRLTEIVRQAEGNPIIAAASALRLQQGGAIDWTWCQPAEARPYGVYVPPRERVDAWLRKAFLSDAMKADPDTFRYIAWTNAKVAAVNARVRTWIYGHEARNSPFMVGERAMSRSAVIVDESVQVQTNEEFSVLKIERSEFFFDLKDHGIIDRWTAMIPSWKLLVLLDDGSQHTLHMASDTRAYEAVRERIIAEARVDRERWQERREFDDALAKIQPIYAMTVHTSQGSTFGTAFLDVGDIRRRVADNLLEAQQLLYVGVTRPSTSLILVGAA